MKPSIQPFVAELVGARRRRGWTQQALGKRTGLPQSHISRIERGQVDVGLSNLIQIARALELEVMLVPRAAVTAVESLRRRHLEKSPPSSGRAAPAYRLDEDDES